MKTKKRAIIAYGLLFACASIVAVGLFGAASARADGAFVTLDTFSGSPGATVNISGGGFTPGETVNIFLGNLSGSPAATSTASSSSLFGPVAVTVPTNATQGPLIIAAVGASSSISANNSYYIEPLFPAITVTSTANTPGSILYISGTGYALNETVRLSLGNASDTTLADASGSFASVPFAIPFIAPGTYPITGLGVGSQASATDDFYVGGFYPSVSPSIYFALPGDAIYFSGSGFAPSEEVNVFEDANQTSTLNVSTNASGSFENAGPVTIPFGLTGDSTTFVFMGASSSASTSQTISLGSFTPWITSSANWLSRGNSFTINAFGFAANETVNVSVYGNASENVPANASGTAAAGPFVVPLSASSTLLVSATGNSSGANASTSITVSDLVPQQFSSSTLAVSLLVDNTAGGAATSSDFTVTVSGADANPSSFAGVASSTAVTVDGDTDFAVSATSSMQNYVLSSSGNCAGQIPSALSDVCSLMETFTVPSVAPATIVIQPSDLSDGTLNTPYSATIGASTIASGTFTWDVASGTLPAGIILDTSSTASTTSLSGTPTATGTFNFAIAATSGSSTAQQAYAFTIDPPAPSNDPVNTGGGVVSVGGGGGGGGGGYFEPTTTVQDINAITTTPTSVGAVLGASTMNVNALSTQLLALEQQLISDQFTAASCTATFNENLQEGMMGAAVQNLQRALNDSGMTQVAATGPGSPGNESTYFGPATMKAVIRFQNIFAAQILQPNGLSAGDGFVGPSTRSELNALCSGDSSTQLSASILNR